MYDFLRSSLCVVALAVAGCADAVVVVRADASSCSAATAPVCYLAHNGLCGDSSALPLCVDGAWSCPAGSIGGGACRCFVAQAPDASGACTCGASGWECPDAGTASPQPAACGDALSCDRNTEYCQELRGGASDGTRYSCEALPAACVVEPSCPCLVPMPGASTCSRADDRLFHVAINAP